MKQLTYLLAVILSVALFSDNVFAAKTTVTVTNNTPYALDVIYKAVGCVKIESDGVGAWTVEVCKVIEDVQPGETVSYEFGGGTSGRKAWAEIVSATCAGPGCSDYPQMMISPNDPKWEWIDNWNDIYINDEGVGHHAIIGHDTMEWDYSLGDNESNSCAVSGFGILHDAHVTWTKLEIQGELTEFGPKYIADCGGVVQQPEAVFVSLGECETQVENRLMADSNLTLQQVVGVLAERCAAKHRNSKHGHVVSCIAHELNTLVKDNVITAREKGALHACAARAREGF